MNETAKKFLLDNFDDIFSNYQIPKNPLLSSKKKSSKPYGGVSGAYVVNSFGTTDGRDTGGIAGDTVAIENESSFCAGAAVGGIAALAAAVILASIFDEKNTQYGGSWNNNHNIPDDLFTDNRALFYETICKLCDEKKMTESQLYTKACVSRAVFSNIRGMRRNNKYIPKKHTVMQLCIALELPLNDAQILMGLVGYSFSVLIGEDKFIAYCLEHPDEYAGDVGTIDEIFKKKLGRSPFKIIEDDNKKTEEKEETYT